MRANEGIPHWTGALGLIPSRLMTRYPYVWWTLRVLAFWNVLVAILAFSGILRAPRFSPDWWLA